MLLSMLKENVASVDKYSQIAKTLRNIEGCNIKSKIFASSSKIATGVSDFEKSIDIEETDFSKNENSFTVYVNKYGPLRYHEFSSVTDLVFANICTFQSHWQLNKLADLQMKLYNSYNYSDDIRYEGRLLELPLRTEEFKLVIILPNEVDLLDTLFFTLTNHGLAATINSIQPLFTTTSKLTLPDIDVASRVQINNKITAISDGLTVQYGSIALSELGTRVRVLTCLYVPGSTVTAFDEKTFKVGLPPPPKPYYYALVYNDTPIFYGDFNKVVVRTHNRPI